MYTFASSFLPFWQCYDQYLLKSLRKAAEARGRPFWGKGPNNAGFYNSRPHETGFFSDGGEYDGYYGRFFLNWYSQVLVDHGDLILSLAKLAFEDTCIAAKVTWACQLLLFHYFLWHRFYAIFFDGKKVVRFTSTLSSSKSPILFLLCMVSSKPDSSVCPITHESFSGEGWLGICRSCIGRRWQIRMYLGRQYEVTIFPLQHED